MDGKSSGLVEKGGMRMSGMSVANRCLMFICIFLVSLSATAQENRYSDGDYLVLPGDVLQVSVWKEPDLDMEVLVRPDAAFSFPLAGNISTRGKSVPYLQEELTQRLSRFLSEPVVTVTVKEVLGNKVYVIGQVNRPGEFIVNPRIDVMQALSMAGGTTPFAVLNDVKILRRNGKEQIAISFRYDEVAKGRNLSQNIILQSGDIVVVP